MSNSPLTHENAFEVVFQQNKFGFLEKLLKTQVIHKNTIKNK